MADVTDIADERYGAQHERNIEEIRKAAQRRELDPKGRCHFCERDFGPADLRVFCDADCATDHERLKRNKR